MVTRSASELVLDREVLGAVSGVADPELPPVTIGDLGLVVGVTVTGSQAKVALVPTYSGCPATELIRQDVESAVLAVPGIDDVEVRFVADVVWTPERISRRGRDKLREFGIAPPQAPAGNAPLVVQIGRVRCPLCGSRNTAVDSPFGPTPCRSTHYCNDCRNPFEAIKA